MALFHRDAILRFGDDTFRLRNERKHVLSQILLILCGDSILFISRLVTLLISRLQRVFILFVETLCATDARSVFSSNPDRRQRGSVGTSHLWNQWTSLTRPLAQLIDGGSGSELVLLRCQAVYPGTQR